MTFLSLILSCQAANATYAVHLDQDLGPVQPGVLGVNSPDKHLRWDGNPEVGRRIREGGFKVVRTGLVQDGIYQNYDVYPSPGLYRLDRVDRKLRQIFKAGAEPIVSIVGFPAGVPHRLDKDAKIVEADWDAYARFAAGTVRHYNVDLAAGRKIRYWELWNEPTDEPDGKFVSREQYATFVRKVAKAMRAVDPNVRLIGPVAPWSDMSPNGWPAFAARELSKEIDVICWHDYGGQADQSDDDRMAWPRAHYGDNVRFVLAGGDKGQFASPPGKRFGAAITEYNMSWGGGPPEYLAKYRSPYNAAYLGASLVQAFRSGLELFCQYLLAQEGINNLGLLDNRAYTPYRPFFVFPLFARHIGTRILRLDGETPGLEILATRKGRGVALHLVNTSLAVKTVVVSGLPKGKTVLWRLDEKANGDQAHPFPDCKGTLTLSLPARSVSAVEVGTASTQ